MKKNKKKYILFGSEYLLGQKIETILKRKHECISVPCKMYKIIDNKDSCSKNLSHLVAQCYYEQATGIIIDSDSLLFYLKNTDKKEILDSFYIF